jgi:hypothetical protein
MQQLSLTDIPLAQHVSGNFMPIFRSARPCFTAFGPESRGADYVYGVEGDARAAPSTLTTQSAPRLSGPQPGSKTGCRKPKAVKHGPALLKMSIKLPEIC